MNAASNRFYGTTLTNRMKKTTEEVEVLNRMKAPYGKKAMIIRAAKIPKALYGCEVAPANENALRRFRTSITKTLAYTTEQRSADLTFATCSFGPDLDPDIHIFTKRAVALRRYLTRKESQVTKGKGVTSKSVWKDAEEENIRKVNAIMMRYKEAGDPGVHRIGDDQQTKEGGGDPGSKERAMLRENVSLRGHAAYCWNQYTCKPQLWIQNSGYCSITSKRLT